MKIAIDKSAGHSDPAWSVAFNPTRPLLASCSTDKTVRLFSYTYPSSDDTPAETSTTFPSEHSPKPSFHLVTSIPTSHKRTIRSVAWAPSGKTLATGSFDSTVGVWEEVDPEAGGGAEGIERADNGSAETSKEWECVTVLEGHDSECKSVGFSADGALLASCSRDKSVWVWEGEYCPSDTLSR
jgi:WD40 repeat protein